MSLSVSWRHHFPGASAGKGVAYCYFRLQGPLFLNSSSTEETLLSMCTVRQAKVYADPTRTKDRSCSQSVWFCSMITHVHMYPGSHTWNRLSLSGRNLNIHLTVRTCCPVILKCLVPWKNIWKGSASTRTINSRTLWRTRFRYDHRNSWSTASFSSLINGIFAYGAHFK